MEPGPAWNIGASPWHGKRKKEGMQEVLDQSAQKARGRRACRAGKQRKGRARRWLAAPVALGRAPGLRRLAQRCCGLQKALRPGEGRGLPGGLELQLFGGPAGGGAGAGSPNGRGAAALESGGLAAGRLAAGRLAAGGRGSGAAKPGAARNGPAKPGPAQPGAAAKNGPGRAARPGGKQNAPGGRQNPPGSGQNAPGGKQNAPGGKQNALGGKQNAPGGPADGEATQQARAIFALLAGRYGLPPDDLAGLHRALAREGSRTPATGQPEAMGQPQPGQREATGQLQADGQSGPADQSRPGQPQGAGQPQAAGQREATGQPEPTGQLQADGQPQPGKLPTEVQPEDTGQHQPGQREAMGQPQTEGQPEATGQPQPGQPEAMGQPQPGQLPDANQSQTAGQPEATGQPQATSQPRPAAPAAAERLERARRAGRRCAQWLREAAQARQDYPGLDLKAELAAPTRGRFLALLRGGVDVKTAYEVLHKEELIGGAMHYAAQVTERQTLERLRERTSRPRENGGGTAPAAPAKKDPRAFTKKERDEIARRVMRGERIEF